MLLCIRQEWRKECELVHIFLYMYLILYMHRFFDITCSSIVMYSKTKIFQIKAMIILPLLFACSSDIKIAPHMDSGLLYGFELSPKSYELVQVPVQNTHIFDFSLQAHEKTTIYTIQFIEEDDENVLWEIESLLQPPITLSVDSKINMDILVTAQTTGLFEQEIEIVSNREDWNIVLQIEGILP